MAWEARHGTHEHGPKRFEANVAAQGKRFVFMGSRFAADAVPRNDMALNAYSAASRLASPRL